MSLSVEKNLRKAQSHLKAGEFAEAETLYKAILLKFPKNKKAIEGYQRVNSGVTAHKSPSFEPPQDQIQALLRLYHNRQFQDLFANAENLARQYPNSVLIYNILGMANASLQNSEAAIWNFQQAINAKPDYAESHYNLGISLQTIGKIDAAISSFQRAIKINRTILHPVCMMI
jgi:protein O-GlcNAc transferase